MITDIKQKILNDILRQEEKILFLADEDNKAWNTVGNMIELITLGAIPTDYNIYGRVIRISEEMHKSGMTPYMYARDSFLLYLNSILGGDTKDVRDSYYNILMHNIEDNYMVENDLAK